ncbi:MAG: outer membrane protein assembly factor BamC [Lautropia sp.]|nr:outer membrane protein assembly factor BamC [Lautropia sp.]
MFDSLRGNGRPVWPALLVPLVLLGGCSSLRDVLDPDNVEYRNARRGPGLDIPPDLVAPRADSRYTLPGGDDAQSLSDFNRQREDAGRAGSSTAVAQQVLPERAEARIHRDGISRWIAVKAPPEKVWPILQDFWAVQGFNLEVAQPRLGLMETDWAERFQRVETDGVRGILSRKTGAVYATGDRDKYRTRLERADDGGTEIYLTYYGREEQLRGSNKDQSIWVPHDDNRTELEVEYLRRMLARLDGAFSHGELGSAVASGTGAAAVGGETSGTTPASDRSSPAGEKKAVARIVPRDGQPAVLQVDEDFERSWRAVGVVLDRLDFSIEDRDRSQGVYSIVYVDPQRRDQNQGTWSRLFSGERKDLSGQHYQLRIRGEGGQSTVSVLLANGNVPASEEDRRVAQEIIRILNENLH